MVKTHNKAWKIMVNENIELWVLWIFFHIDIFVRLEILLSICYLNIFPVTKNANFSQNIFFQWKNWILLPGILWKYSGNSVQRSQTTFSMISSISSRIKNLIWWFFCQKLFFSMIFAFFATAKLLLLLYLAGILKRTKKSMWKKNPQNPPLKIWDVNSVNKNVSIWSGIWSNPSEFPVSRRSLTGSFSKLRGS